MAYIVVASASVVHAHLCTKMPDILFAWFRASCFMGVGSSSRKMKFHWYYTLLDMAHGHHFLTVGTLLYTNMWTRSMSEAPARSVHRRISLCQSEIPQPAYKFYVRNTPALVVCTSHSHYKHGEGGKDVWKFVEMAPKPTYTGHIHIDIVRRVR